MSISFKFYWLAGKPSSSDALVACSSRPSTLCMLGMTCAFPCALAPSPLVLLLQPPFPFFLVLSLYFSFSVPLRSLCRFSKSVLTRLVHAWWVNKTERVVLTLPRTHFTSSTRLYTVACDRLYSRFRSVSSFLSIASVRGLKEFSKRAEDAKSRSSPIK